MVAYHGISLSIVRPTIGAMATPNIPTRPKSPMTSLHTVNHGDVMGTLEDVAYVE